MTSHPLQIDAILKGRELTCTFQRIVDLESGEVLAWEAGVEGPVNSPFHSFQSLLKAAHAARRDTELECLAVVMAREVFATLAMPQSLLLKVRPSAFSLPEGAMRSIFSEFGKICDKSIVHLCDPLGIAEHEKVRHAIAALRRCGIRVALDLLWDGILDAGAWAEARPEFLKVNAKSIVGVEPLGTESYFATVTQLAERHRCRIIVDDIDEPALLNAIRKAGYRYGQGRHLGSPIPESELHKNVGMSGVVIVHQDSPPNQSNDSGVGTFSVSQLLKHAPTIAPQATANEVYELFERAPDVYSIAVVRDGEPIGVINREHVVNSFAKPYSRELHGKKMCTYFMDHSPLIVDKDVSIQELSAAVVDADRRHLISGFIITDNGAYIGIADSHDLLRKITEMQMAAARHANPLTQLPGNVIIQERVTRALTHHKAFVVCYVDLDYFKPYNDIYGFHLGDKVIRVAADVITRHVDHGMDFVGHIGGDDFVILFESPDWEDRCKRILEDFGNEVPGFYKDEDFRRGGCETEDRAGIVRFHPLISMSLGLVKVSSEDCFSHHHILSMATVAKKQAKKLPGNSMFVERRSH